ncbi:TatD family hydrolase [Candidatus Peregrinibacteria bacterium]|nr:TatD family hydrolase [Candidatus Peregrinibacteria bacterium]
MIDSHCHLAHAKFDADREEVIARAVAAGVTRMVCIADSLAEAEKCVALSKDHPEIFCTVGVHPHGAKDWSFDAAPSSAIELRQGRQDDISRARLMTLVASSQKVRAIGEIGLDFHYDFSPRAIQREVFRLQLTLAKELNLPAVIHNRESIEDLTAIIEEVDPPRFVLHCCTEPWENVRNLVDRGGLLSFTCIATYPNAEVIRETIRQCPLSQMMIETDAPYLVPVPHRGKRNEPAFVVEVAKKIAEIKGVDFEEVDRVTSENANQFFDLLV